MSQVLGSPNAVHTKNRHSFASSLTEDHPHTAKRTGVLSQTLAPSPHVRWILQARLRSRAHNDVIFVGDSGLQLREFLSNGQLTCTIAVLNIGVQILTAKVISAKTEKIPFRDAVLDQEWDEERFLINGKPCAPDQPPQIVVLCTSTSELIYVYAKTLTDGGTKFVFAKRNILHGVSMINKYGRHMAVDAESRALAVASTNTIALFSLKHVDELKQSIDSWQPKQPAAFHPNSEQRFIPVDGTILQMTFLQRPADDQNMVFLLLMVAKAEETRLLLYKWDIRESLMTTRAMKCSGYVFESRDAFPMLLWPSAKPLSFSIVTDTEIATYDNIHSSSVKRTGISLKAKNGNNARQLWVQWVKPWRHERYEKEKEDVLLVREDGATQMLSRVYNPPRDQVVDFNPGDLNMHVDTAVCILPGPRYMSGDVLVVGGIVSNGGVFHLEPIKQPRLMQVIPNVSPVHKMVVMNKDALPKDRGNVSGRTFVLSDSLRGEQLSELRFGLEAQIGWTIPLEDCGAIEHLFVLEQGSTKKLYFIASFLEHTIAVEFDPGNPQDIQLLEDPEECPGFDLGAPTHAAVNLTSGHIVLITSKSITVVSDSVRHSSPAVSSPLCDCTVANVDGASGFFIAACKGPTGNELRMGMIDDSAQNPQIITAPHPELLTSQPLCLATTHTNAVRIVAAGFSDGSISIFTAHSGEGLQPYADFPANGAGISSIAVLKHEECPNLLVLSGSRDGILDLFTLDLNGKQRGSMGLLRKLSTYKLCTSTVAIVSEHGSTSALIITGTRTARLTLLKNRGAVDYIFNNVWITSPNDMSFDAPSLGTACRVPPIRFNKGDEPSGFIMYTTKDEILVTSLVEQEQMVPKSLATCEDAYHFQYSKYLKQFIVATGTDYAADGKPVTPPSIHVLQSEISTATRNIFRIGEYGEHVKALINWTPSDGKRHYEMVMVGLTDGQNSRVGHITVKKLRNEQENGGLLKTVLRFANKEVHALCAYGMSSVLISAGHQLMLLHLDMGTKKFRQLANYDLPSPAISLSSRGSYVYVATERHSMYVLRVQDDKFTKIFSDKIAKNTRSIFPFGKDGRHVMVTTLLDGGSRISGYIDGSTSLDASIPSFEAQMPIPIDNLTQIDAYWTHDQHYCFQGSTINGAIQLFKTVTYEEWKLLHFLERLADPNITKPVKKMSLLTKKMARAWIGAAEHDTHITFDPKRMHINGDVLQHLIEGGSHNLRILLGPEVKSEDDMVVDTERTRFARFAAVATPIVGSVVDPVDAVVAWTRRLLRSTVF